MPPLRANGEIQAATAVWDCAQELDQAWHEHAHDGQWFPGECHICRHEMSQRNP